MCSRRCISMSLKKPPKILNLREFQMAKRMLLGRKEAPCQKELAAVLNAMDRREGVDAAGLRILRAALEHCMHEAVSCLMLSPRKGYVHVSQPNTSGFCDSQAQKADKRLCVSMFCRRWRGDGVRAIRRLDT